MNLKHFMMSAGVLFAGVAATIGSMQAQGPLYDKVIVDLPYKVSLNNTVLEPGHYVIRQLDTAGGGSRVLQIFTDNGMKLKTTTQTIATLDNNTPESTKVVLHHYGQDYYFDKIWIQGKNYGYEFPLPPAVKSRQSERMEPYTVAAKYEPTAPKEETVASNSSTVNSAPATTAANTATTGNTATSAPAANTSTDSTSTIARNQTPSNTGNSSSVSNAQQTSTDDDSRSSRRMPKTGGDWLMMLLSGGMLSGAGLLLRKSAAR
ncbi:MAG: hypothetical protein M3Z23_04235 [Acidobacteriota bacterium]|nr:hypothetical protein [Acidobacteriota bacterium]